MNNRMTNKQHNPQQNWYSLLPPFPFIRSSVRNSSVRLFDCSKKILPILLLFSLLPILPSHAAQNEIGDLTSQGNESFTRGEFDKAAKFYDKALKIEAKNPTILYNRANTLFQQEKYLEAFAKYKEALKAAPSRRLISSISFNAGNTALKLAEAETKEKQGLEELQKSISYYESSFSMYRKALSQARAVSIAEGRNVQDAGLSAKKNWALAREYWTAALDKIKTLQKKNMTIEDGIRSLLAAQSNLIPTLEGTFLNSLSEDTLKFNLKRLAEYQLDYQEEITTLRELAAKQEKETKSKIANLKPTTPPVTPGATSPPSQDQETAESAELAQQLATAQEIKKAVQQAAELDEWIVDNLKKNQAMEAWQNAHKMVDLLQDLSSFLEGNDPVLNAYQNAITLLETAEELLIQAKSLATIKDNTNAKLASQRRTTLAGAKTSSAGMSLTKINFYLAKIKENQKEEDRKAASDPQAGTPSTSTKEEQAKSDNHKILQQAMEDIASEYLNELQARNKKLANTLLEENNNLAESDINLANLLTECRASLLWYQHLGSSVSQLTASLIKDSNTAADIISRKLETTKTRNQPEDSLQEDALLRSQTSEEQMKILLFQLDKIVNYLKNDPPAAVEAAQLQALKQSLLKSSKFLHSTWLQEQKLQVNLPNDASIPALLNALADLRLALIRNLLIFSPDMAITLYFERTSDLQGQLLELLPVEPKLISTLKKRYNRSASEAAALNSLLVSYLDNLKKSVTAMASKEKQETYQESLLKREKAVPFIQRLIDAGQAASSLLNSQKFQEAEILFKDMPSSLQKAHLAFNEQPKEAEKALNLAIDLQKKLEEQCRAANEAVTIENEPAKLITYIAANQIDINTLSDKAILLLQNMIGMTDIPSHGQDQQAPAAKEQQVDSKKLNEAIDLVKDAQEKMTQIHAFLRAGEFHNTFNKHQEILTLLQEALDLLKNKSQKEEDKKDDSKKDNKEKKKDDQGQEQQKQQNGAGQGKSQPKKPLELSPRQAKELLKQLNKQDEKQQQRTTPGSTGREQINTPRPW